MNSSPTHFTLRLQYSYDRKRSLISFYTHSHTNTHAQEASKGNSTEK